MARNFKVSASQRGDSLHLALRGDFDGTSACELLNLLKKKRRAASKAVIDTGGLRHVYGFGRDTFQRNAYTLKRAGLQLIFCGKNAEEIAPERYVIL
jgi:anti-anti-sigma regulatory factor